MLFRFENQINHFGLRFRVESPHGEANLDPLELSTGSIRVEHPSDMARSQTVTRVGCATTGTKVITCSFSYSLTPLVSKSTCFLVFRLTSIGNVDFIVL